jgi:hypothetical protein
MTDTADTKSLSKRLKKTSAFKQLGDLIRTVLITETRADFHFMKKALPALKQLICELVDNAWESSRTTIENTLPKPVRHIRHITSLPRFRENSSRNQVGLSFESGDGGKSKENRNVGSDYGGIKGPVSFTRSIREMNKVRAASPGPSCYFFESLKNKNRSPRVVFPKGVVERNSYIPNSVSPGPNKYYSALRKS